MIIDLDQLLREIPKTRDTLNIVDYVTTEILPNMPEHEACEVRELCKNALAMYDMLRSARMHLATKALDHT